LTACRTRAILAANVRTGADMPMIEVIYVSERELAPEQLDAFARRARGACAEVLGSAPEQVRVAAQRCAGAAPQADVAGGDAA
jgi:phenylpyruvate tautomerase PptA (4-oxalocrotonate tautomerase family)